MAEPPPLTGPAGGDCSSSAVEAGGAAPAVPPAAPGIEPPPAPLRWSAMPAAAAAAGSAGERHRWSADAADEPSSDDESARYVHVGVLWAGSAAPGTWRFSGRRIGATPGRWRRPPATPVRPVRVSPGTAGHRRRAVLAAGGDLCSNSRGAVCRARRSLIARHCARQTRSRNLALDF